MKYIILLVSLICLAFNHKTETYKKTPRNTSFSQGEILTYRLHYGLFTAGEATVRVEPHTKQIKGKTCYDFSLWLTPFVRFCFLIPQPGSLTPHTSGLACPHASLLARGRPGTRPRARAFPWSARCG